MSAPGPHWPGWLPYEGEDDGDPRPLSPAGMTAMEARLEAEMPGFSKMTPAEILAARGGVPPLDADAVAAAALAPPPPFELTDEQCARVAALLAPYAVQEGGEQE